MVFGEKIGGGGFNAGGGGATKEASEKKELVDMERHGRMAVFVAIEDSGEFGDGDVEAGFFFDLADGDGAGGFTDVGPTTGKSPEAVFAFLNEEDAVAIEDGGADIDFGSGVPEIIFEDVEERSGIGEGGAVGHDVGGEALDFFVALAIIGIFAEGETGLRDSLETTGPVEPLGI